MPEGSGYDIENTNFGRGRNALRRLFGGKKQNVPAEDDLGLSDLEKGKARGWYNALFNYGHIADGQPVLMGYNRPDLDKPNKVSHQGTFVVRRDPKTGAFFFTEPDKDTRYSAYAAKVVDIYDPLPAGGLRDKMVRAAALAPESEVKLEPKASPAVQKPLDGPSLADVLKGSASHPDLLKIRALGRVLGYEIPSVDAHLADTDQTTRRALENLAAGTGLDMAAHTPESFTKALLEKVKANPALIAQKMGSASYMVYSEDVKAVQAVFNLLGMRDANGQELDIDGLWGPRTNESNEMYKKFLENLPSAQPAPANAPLSP